MRPLMIRKKQKKYSCVGFTLVEIMVGMVLGLLTVLVIAQSFMAFEGQKRTTTSGSDAQENGLIALHTLAADLRMVGYGLITNGALGCTTLNTYNSATTPTTQLGIPLAPVLITDGGTGPDTITLLYSSSAFASVPAKLTTLHSTSAANLVVNNVAGFNDGDIVIVASPTVPGQPCTRLQVTGTPGASLNIIHNSGAASNLNPPGGFNIFPTNPPSPATGYDSNSVVFDMGTMVNNQYMVLCSTLTVTNLVTQGAPGCTDQNTFTNATAVAGNIVNIQAQYGIAPAGSQSVNCWVNATTGNACDAGDWTPAGVAAAAANVARIKAVRIAVVARSSLLEKPTVTPGASDDGCRVTGSPIPTWSGGPTIPLSATDQSRCYRYKVYQTVIPLRNVLWANL